MARKKEDTDLIEPTETPEVTETPELTETPETTETPEPTETPESLKKYVSNKIRLHHPDQNVYLVPGEPVELKMDSWLDSQVKAGLVSECS